MQHGHTVANVFTVVLRYVVVMMVLFHSYNPFNYLSPIQKPWKPENVWATYFRAAYRILYYLWLAHIAAGIITSYSVRWIGMSLLLKVESFLIWSLTNTTKCSVIFISFLCNFMRNFYSKLRYFYWFFWILLAQLLIGALLLLKFHNYDRAIFIRCATFIRYRRVVTLLTSNTYNGT